MQNGVGVITGTLRAVRLTRKSFMAYRGRRAGQKNQEFPGCSEKFTPYSVPYKY